MKNDDTKIIFSIILFFLYAICLVLLAPSLCKFINTSFTITIPDLWNTSTWQQLMRLFAIITSIFTLGITCIFVFLIYIFFHAIVNFNKVFNKEKGLNFEIIVMIITVFISCISILSLLIPNSHNNYTNNSNYTTINDVEVYNEDGFFTNKHYNVGNDIKRAKNSCTEYGGRLATIEDYEKIMKEMDKYSAFKEYPDDVFFYFSKNNSMWDKGAYYYSSSKISGKNIILRVLPKQTNKSIYLNSPNCRENSNGLYSCITTVSYSQDSYKSLERLPNDAYRKYKCVK